MSFIDGRMIYDIDGVVLTDKIKQQDAELAQNTKKISHIVNVKQPPYNAKGGGVDDTAIIQQILSDFPNGCNLIIPEEITITSIALPTSFAGTVEGKGKLKALPNTSIGSIVKLDRCSNIVWEVAIDMSQTSNTLPTDLRSQVGLEIINCRDIDVNNLMVENVRIGRPIYINGTSSNAPVETDGSKRIRVNKMTCIAYEYDVVDEGAYPVIRSDFYTGDGGGVYMPGSNALKKSDYSIDTTVSYRATTENIVFKDCHFENMDRVAILNVENIEFDNCNLLNQYTRGYNFSPTVTNARVRGGKVSGGTASLIPFAYGCKNCIVDGVSVDGLLGSVGEQTTLKTYFGCEDIVFSNITGFGAPQNHIYVHSSKRISFDNIKLRKSKTGNTVDAISVSGGEQGNSASYETADISVQNSSFESGYGLNIHKHTGTATISLGGVKVHNVAFEKTLQLLNGVLPTKGELDFCFNSAKKSSSAQDLLSKSFKFFMNSSIQCQMIEQIIATGATTYPTFPNVYYYCPERDGSGGDGTRNPSVLVFKNGQLLTYGIDWFCDGTMAGTMQNKIRMYDANTIVNGDKITMVRST